MSEPKIDDGGPAFPVTNLDAPPSAWGMSLRDYFAAKALPVVAPGNHGQDEPFLRYGTYEDTAADAYKMADAMLKAREP